MSISISVNLKNRSKFKKKIGKIKFEIQIFWNFFCPTTNKKTRKEIEKKYVKASVLRLGRERNKQNKQSSFSDLGL